MTPAIAPEPIPNTRRHFFNRRRLVCWGGVDLGMVAMKLLVWCGSISLAMPLNYAIASVFSINRPAQSQVIPDSTLPVNSQVTNNGNTSIINGGTTRGTNLFHSFREFSLT
jgi:hypothetical protein